MVKEAVCIKPRRWTLAVMICIWLNLEIPYRSCNYTQGHIDKGKLSTLPDGITIWVHEEGSDLESQVTPNKNNGSYVFTDPCKEYDVEYTKLVNINGKLDEKSFYHQSLKFLANLITKKF